MIWSSTSSWSWSGEKYEIGDKTIIKWSLSYDHPYHQAESMTLETMRGDRSTNHSSFFPEQGNKHFHLKTMTVLNINWRNFDRSNQLWILLTSSHSIVWSSTNNDKGMKGPCTWKPKHQTWILGKNLTNFIFPCYIEPYIIQCIHRKSPAAIFCNRVV